MGLIALCLYTSVLFFMTWKIHRQGRSVASFFINDRSSSATSVGLSIIVTCVGASSTIGVVGMAFTLGTPAIWWLGMGAFSILILSLCLAKKVRASEAFTMPQLVEMFLGKSVRPIVSTVIVVAWIAILAAQFSAMIRILHALTSFAPMICLGIAIFLIVVHTLSGGQAAVMRLDRLQSLVIFLGLTATCLWLTNANPEWPSKVSLELINDQFPMEKLIYYFFIIGGSYLICPMLFGRLLSAKDVATARKGGAIAASGLVFFAILIVSIGLACRGLIPADTPADAILTTALSSILPKWLYLGILLALLSAVISSADSCLITSSTILCYDLLKKTNTTTCRFCIVALGGAGALVSFMDKSILGFLFMSYDIYVCGVVVPVFISMLASEKYSISSKFACAAVCTGGTLGAIANFTDITAWSYAGLSGAALLTIAGMRRKTKQIQAT